MIRPLGSTSSGWAAKGIGSTSALLLALAVRCPLWGCEGPFSGPLQGSQMLFRVIHLGMVFLLCFGRILLVGSTGLGPIKNISNCSRKGRCASGGHGNSVRLGLRGRCV